MREKGDSAVDGTSGVGLEGGGRVRWDSSERSLAVTSTGWVNRTQSTPWNPISPSSSIFSQLETLTSSYQPSTSQIGRAIRPTRSSTTAFSSFSPARTKGRSGFSLLCASDDTLSLVESCRGPPESWR